ncbi:MAG: glycosyltransferase family 2 protein [Bdellovibrionales bacterium]
MRSLSLVVITKNEAHNIARCLDSVPFATDKVVVDSGSTDETVAIAKRHGARVFTEEWKGFYQQKVKATNFAAHDWVLNLDADEALSPEAAEEVQKLLNESELAPAYALPRLSFHLGKWIRHGGWFPDWQVRLFDRKIAQWQAGEVHERVEAPQVGRLKQPIHHWVFSDLTDQIETNNRYSGLGAVELQKRGKKFSPLKLLFKPVFKFFETYLWKCGFMDGMPGFIIAVGAAYSMFLKYAKLWETEKLSHSKTKNEK